MKRAIFIATFALSCFMLGSVFTIGVGNYLAGDASQAPAVIQPSNFRRTE